MRVGVYHRGIRSIDMGQQRIKSMHTYVSVTSSNILWADSTGGRKIDKSGSELYRLVRDGGPPMNGNRCRSGS